MFQQKLPLSLKFRPTLLPAFKKIKNPVIEQFEIRIDDEMLRPYFLKPERSDWAWKIK